MPDAAVARRCNLCHSLLSSSYHLHMTGSIWGHYRLAPPLTPPPRCLCQNTTDTDQVLTSCHRNNTNMKAYRMLGFVKRNIISRHPSILLNVYKSFVRSHLEYCSTVWSTHYKKDKALLERVQHRFTRMFSHLRQLGLLHKVGYARFMDLGRAKK